MTQTKMENTTVRINTFKIEEKEYDYEYTSINLRFKQVFATIKFLIVAENELSEGAIEFASNLLKNRIVSEYSGTMSYYDFEILCKKLIRTINAEIYTENNQSFWFSFQK